MKLESILNFLSKGYNDENNLSCLVGMGNLSFAFYHAKELFKRYSLSDENRWEKVLYCRLNKLSKHIQDLEESNSNGIVWFENYGDIDNFLIDELDKLGVEFPIIDDDNISANTIEAIKMLIKHTSK